jgi:hypothetical protein
VRRLPLIAIALIGAGSLAFDLTLSWRLPSESDWAEAAGALRARAATGGDALQIWPVWAERARLFVDAMPVLAEEDLAHADYFAVQRLWVLSLPRSPFFVKPDAALAQRGATPASDEFRFGALALRAWDLHAPAIAEDLTPTDEEHEVDYVARRCKRVEIGSSFSLAHYVGSTARTLHLRAGVIGERAYDARRPAIEVTVHAHDEQFGPLIVPPTLRDGTGWRRLDLPLPAAPISVWRVEISSPDRDRPFCLKAWTTR